MDESTALASIMTIRLNPTYQQAERMRLKSKGAMEMAAAPMDSDQFAAVQTLVSAWEVIATIIEGVPNKGAIYDTLPACYMHNALKDAIAHISLRRANLKSPGEFDIPNAGYGAKFGKLANDYHNWLIAERKSTQYITGSCGGMYACFG